MLYHKLSKSLMKTDFLIHANFLTMISICLFYYCEKVFTHMNIWMTGKNSVKLHYLEKRSLHSPKCGRC